MRSPWRPWVTLLSDREEGTSLALFRIALGLTTLFSLLSIAGAGLVEPLWTGLKHGGMRDLSGNWLVVSLGGPTPGVIWTLWITALCSAIAFTLGIGGRVVGRAICLALLLSYNGLITMNPFASGGYDVLMTNAFWILFLGQPNATLSLHCWRIEGALTSSRQVPAWPRYVLLFQLLLMYSFTGLQKTALVWTPAGGYTALYWITQDPTWMRFDGAFAAWITPLLRIGTAITWHWEQLTLLLLLWYYARYTSERGGRMRRWVLRRDWRIGWMCIGIILHLGILVLVNVGPFSWVTLAFYVLLWRPSELRAGLARWRKWRHRNS